MRKLGLGFIAAIGLVTALATHESGHAGLFSWFGGEDKHQTEWAEWQGYKNAFITRDGRVTDHSTEDKRTVSEGQAYAMFLSLVANDRATFDKLLTWSANNLAKGDLTRTLPAWIWGNQDGNWVIKDSNSASDADLWMMYSLLEASRLWCNPEYERIGRSMGNLILAEEVIHVTGLGLTLLPGKVGFVAEDGSVKLNPSYVPPFLMARLAHLHPSQPEWTKLYLSSQALLLDSHRNGLYPDWISYKNGQSDGAIEAGDYDAIRVYLWAAMTPDTDPAYPALANGIRPYLMAIQKRGATAESWNPAAGTLSASSGPDGFEWAISLAMKRILGENRNPPRLPLDSKTAWQSYGYYNGMLSLFAQGVITGKYAFGVKGELIRAGRKEGSCD